MIYAVCTDTYENYNKEIYGMENWYEVEADTAKDAVLEVVNVACSDEQVICCNLSSIEEGQSGELVYAFRKDDGTYKIKVMSE